MGWFIAYGAVVRKELLIHARRKSLFAALLAPCALESLLAMAYWPTDTLAWYQAQAVSHTMFSMTTVILLIPTTLIVPVLAGSAIVSEREKRTWELLLASPIGPAALTLGKATATLAVVLVLAIALMPFAAVVFFLVGIDIWQFATVWGLLLLAGAAIALGGLAASACFQRTTHAVALAFAVSFWIIGFHWAILIELGNTYLITEPFETYANQVQGLITLFVLVNTAESGASSLSSQIIINGAYLAATGGAGLLLTRVFLPRVRRARPRRKSLVRDRVWRFLSALQSFPKRLPISDRIDPIFLKELYWTIPIPRYRTAVFGGISACAGFLMAVVLCDRAEYGSGSTDSIYAVSFSATSFLLSCAFVPLLAGIISFEYDRGTIVDLAMLPTAPRRIALSKVCAAMWAAMPLLLCPVALFGWLAMQPIPLTRNVEYVDTLHVYTVWCTFCLLTCALFITLTAALFGRTPTQSIAVSIFGLCGVGFGAWGFAVLLGMAFAAMLDLSPVTRQDLWLSFAYLSPVTTYLEGVTSIADGSRGIAIRTATIVLSIYATGAVTVFVFALNRFNFRLHAPESRARLARSRKSRTIYGSSNVGE